MKYDEKETDTEDLRNLADSEELPSISKRDISNSKGFTYHQFRKNLNPRYSVVWRDIGLIYFSGVVAAYLIVLAQNSLPGVFVLTIPIGAVLLGYILASLHLFWHEAAHRLIAPGEKLNDRLANLFIGIWVGQNIAEYRVNHFAHHRYHGDTNDTEHSYFDSLNMRYIVESLVGIKVLKVLIARRKRLNDFPASNSVAFKPGKIIRLLTAFVLHGAILLGSLVSGYWQFSITWLIAMGSAFPFLLALRQLLEHRSKDACADVDYTQVQHGQVNRLFGDGLIASTFGAAGFNRHLLHHWDPSVSYTRLKEVEEFLLDTPHADEIRRSTSSYFKTFIDLYQR